MSALKDLYEIIKELLKAAKAVQNQEVVQFAMELQEKFFELREDNEKLTDEIKELKAKLEALEKADLQEEDIEYHQQGYLTIKNEKIKLYYCNFCWKKERKLYPLSQASTRYDYQCANCKSIIDIDVDMGNNSSDDNGQGYFW